jgi:hypothetical protein
VAINNGGTGYQGYSGTTSSAGTTTTLNDTTQTWAVNSLIGCTVAYGTTFQNQGIVSANTATQLTFSAVSTASTITQAYIVGDVIRLPMDETTGTYGNSVYWQAKTVVNNAVAGVIQASGVTLVPAQYGQPGGPTQTTNGNFGFPNNIGGAYSNLLLPPNPVNQSDPGGSTTGSGTGASFNLTFHAYNGVNGWPGISNWPAVVTLKTTFNGGTPVIITETGEHGGANIANKSPWMNALTGWADTNGISLLAFNYNTGNGWYWPNGSDLMLTVNSSPSLNPNYANGYGAWMWNWFTTHAP